MKKILVVEDDRKNLYLIKYTLEQNGFDVIEAQNGKMGVKLAIKEKPDLIIMGNHLPDIDGLEATRRIIISKADSKNAIVALTSPSISEDREKALAAGCTGYIEKPINPKTLISEIKHFFVRSEIENYFS